MLDVLHQAEKALPELLRCATWHSLFVDYHEPFVQRLWCQWNEVRVYQHCILPCPLGKALFHPHSGPSAMKVLRGGYEMDVGFGSGSEKPPVAMTLILGPGSEYEMVHPDGWHSVRPIDEPSISLMVGGVPWERWSPKSEKPLSPLQDEVRAKLMNYFREYYK